MDNEMDIIQRIDSKFDRLSKGHKQIAAYIRENFDKASFWNVSQFSREVGISEATVVRFAAELGYEKFQSMQRAIQEYAKTKLTSTQRMDITYSRLGEGDVLKNVLNADIDKIRSTLTGMDNSDFNTIVHKIAGAKRIYILGVRSSAALANFLGFYLNMMFDHVKVVDTTSASEMFEQLFRIGEGDVLIGISFPRYSKRTVQALEYARRSGALVIGLTDAKTSPIMEWANYSLLARSDMAFFVDSLVAPMSVINALIVALGGIRRSEVHDTFERLESIWKQYQVYDGEDDGGRFGVE